MLFDPAAPLESPLISIGSTSFLAGVVKGFVRKVKSRIPTLEMEVIGLGGTDWVCGDLCLCWLEGLAEGKGTLSTGRGYPVHL